MKVYLDDEKTHVDPCPHNGHSVGWTVMTETIVLVLATLWYARAWQYLISIALSGTLNHRVA